MTSSFNIQEASDDELKMRLEVLRNDRKTYGTPKRSTKKKAKQSEEDLAAQEMFKDVPPELQEQFSAELLKILEKGASETASE